MTKPIERRRGPRVRGGGPHRARMLGILEVYLLDISLTGARIAHRDPLAPGSAWVLELPPLFGELIIAVRVIHSSASGAQATSDKRAPLRYESGLEFMGLSPVNEAALARAIQKFFPGVVPKEGALSP